MEEDITYVLRLNGIWKEGHFLADTSTELVKRRRDVYLRYERFVRKLAREGKCTSSRIMKKIKQIRTEKQEYAGVLLYFLEKKHKELVGRGV